MNLEAVKNLIRDVPDFPKEGILFKDITPVLSNASAFSFIISEMKERLSSFQVDCLAGIESRGFIFAAALAQEMKCGMTLIRKPGKLPYKTKRQEYSLEYGTDALELHVDAFEMGKNVVIVDDLLATGGTAKAAIDLCEGMGAHVKALACVIELEFLAGRSKLGKTACDSLIQF